MLQTVGALVILAALAVLGTLRTDAECLLVGAKAAIFIDLNAFPHHTQRTSTNTTAPACPPNTTTAAHPMQDQIHRHATSASTRG